MFTHFYVHKVKSTSNKYNLEVTNYFDLVDISTCGCGVNKINIW